MVREQGFISDFLNITSVDASITFADYMMLETFFRRGASAHLARQAQQGKLRDIKTAMELVFGFLEGELKGWIDDVLLKDPMWVASRSGLSLSLCMCMCMCLCMCMCM